MPALSIYCTLLFSESRLMLVTYRLIGAIITHTIVVFLLRFFGEGGSNF